MHTFMFSPKRKKSSDKVFEIEGTLYIQNKKYTTSVSNVLDNNDFISKTISFNLYTFSSEQGDYTLLGNLDGIEELNGEKIKIRGINHGVKYNPYRCRSFEETQYLKLFTKLPYVVVVSFEKLN